MDEYEIQEWLDERYPGVFIKALPGFAGWGVWQTEKRLDYGTMCDGTEFAYVVAGASMIFDTKGRVLGSWVCTEVVRRDPRYCHRPDNYFHQAFLASLEAEKAHERDRKRQQETATQMWNTAKRNEALMNRIFKHMENGRFDLAAEELSPEAMMRAAYLEKPQEIRDRNFWKAI